MSFGSQWANIDDVMSLVSTEHTKFSLEKRELVNSIWTSRLVPQHNMCVYFSNVTAAQTSHLARGTKQWEKNGWIVVQTHDTDNRSYLLAFNPGGATKRFKLPRKLKKMKHLTVKIVDNGTVK